MEIMAFDDLLDMKFKVKGKIGKLTITYNESK